MLGTSTSSVRAPSTVRSCGISLGAAGATTVGGATCEKSSASSVGGTWIEILNVGAARAAGVGFGDSSDATCGFVG